MSWNDEKVNKLKELWGKGNTASEIAQILGGVSRNAVIGKAHRLNLSGKIKSKKIAVNSSKNNSEGKKLSRRGKFNSKISNITENQECWQAHIERAREDLGELIEATLLEKGDCEDIEIARNALADDNAPAVLRALSRIEADSIDVEVEDVSPDGMVLQIDEDAVPFVDLSSEEE